MPCEQRRLAAIVSADVAGYSRLMGRDESGTLAVLKALRREIVDPKIKAHHGRIVKTTGDGLLLEFASVVDAVRCVNDVQAAMAAHNADVPEDRRIEFRIGVNIGDIIIDGDDIFGDGVNVAARLQEIATPGGVCVSGRVHDDVRDKLDTVFEAGGEQALKNIARPVPVWRWSPGSASGGTVPTASVAPLVTDVPLALPDKPSIAVLAFANMSGDPEQEYFTDGVTEDIITELSRFRSLFVIARNSSFSYKGKSPDIRQVGKDLGIRYVLEGSIRRAGNRIRVTAQLIDSLSGNHIWAERYDRVLEDILAVQEELTQAIVGAIAPQIETAEIAKSSRVRPGNLGAYELALRAWSEVRTAYTKSDVSLRQRAIETARRALAADPACALALVTICFAQWQHVAYGSAANADIALAEGLAAGTRAIEIDASNHMAFTLRGMLQYYGGQRRMGLDDLRQAHGQNPNDAWTLSTLGGFEACFGDASKGIAYCTLALRLSPRDYWRMAPLSNLSLSYFLARQYEHGMQAGQTATREAPGLAQGYISLALNLVGLNEVDQAAAAVETARRIAPAYVESRLAGGFPYERPKDLERATTFLRIAAGLENRSAADALR